MAKTKDDIPPEDIDAQAASRDEMLRLGELVKEEAERLIRKQQEQAAP